MKPQTKLPTPKTAKPHYRAQMVESLAQFRQEWQSAADKQSLVGINSSVGLLFSDIANRLELNPKEQFVFLGKELYEETRTVINQPLDLEIA